MKKKETNKKKIKKILIRIKIKKNICIYNKKKKNINFPVRFFFLKNMQQIKVNTPRKGFIYDPRDFGMHGNAQDKQVYTRSMFLSEKEKAEIEKMNPTYLSMTVGDSTNKKLVAFKQLRDAQYEEFRPKRSPHTIKQIKPEKVARRERNFKMMEKLRKERELENQKHMQTIEQQYIDAKMNGAVTTGISSFNYGDMSVNEIENIRETELDEIKNIQYNGGGNDGLIENEENMFSIHSQVDGSDDTVFDTGESIFFESDTYNIHNQSPNTNAYY